MGAEFSVRVGLHSGDVIHAEGDYVGMTVNKAARIAAAARGGEIMVSAVTAELVGDHGFEFGEPMTVTLKGLAGTHRIIPLTWG
jgi:class 3 adenylate cyclase